VNHREREIRDSIAQLVKQLYELRHRQERFVPGESPVLYAGRVHDEREMQALVDCALDFWLTLGRYGANFEKSLADFLGTKHVVMTNSGSSANLLALSSLSSPMLKERRLRPGDEVITVAASFPTTVSPIIQNGLVPVFLDVELGTYNIDTSLLEEAIGKRTRAIFAAHTMGNPFDLDTVMRVAEKHSLFVIEDACDALGSSYDGRMVGTFGHLSTYSFYPAHHITTGEGGAVATMSGKLAWIVRSFRDWGRDCWCDPGEDDACRRRFSYQLGSLPYGYDHKYIYRHIGYNLKPLDLQAAIGVEQLRKLPNFMAARERNFQRLYRGLQRYEGYLILPRALPKADPCWFGFLITVREEAPFGRNHLVNFLEAHKVATRGLFAGNLLRHPAYQEVPHRVVGSLQNTDFVMANTFFIGVYPGLDDAKIDYMLSVFDRFMREKLRKPVGNERDTAARYVQDFSREKDGAL
jgi:CDP-6-deoxy-D-xylo-4-hexulose-3-dehydrase